MQDWTEFIFDKTVSFETRCKEIFRWQAEHNPVYQRFINAFGVSGAAQVSADEIPLLPIRAFKESKLITRKTAHALQFKSSGTGNESRSQHYLPNPELYKKAIESEFYNHFERDKYSLLCYAPGYSENPDSSLIWMMNELINNDTSGLSRFLPLEEPLKSSDIEDIINNKRKIILFGAAFGLIDLLENGSKFLPKNSHIIETGGMKTYRREITKTELRNTLSKGFGIQKSQIHSEYGMCELSSQMYAIGDEYFTSPYWVRVSVRNPENPFEICSPGTEGKIGIIDLANLYSCPFILTEDRGVMDKNGKFQVLGRWNNSDLRGCNFLIDKEI